MYLSYRKYSQVGLNSMDLAILNIMPDILWSVINADLTNFKCIIRFNRQSKLLTRSYYLVFNCWEYGFTFFADIWGCWNSLDSDKVWKVTRRRSQDPESSFHTKWTAKWYRMPTGPVTFKTLFCQVKAFERTCPPYASKQFNYRAESRYWVLYCAHCRLLVEVI